MQSLGILATKLAGKPFGVVVSVIAANFLGPESKGIAAWIVVLVSIASYTFGFGCASALRFVLVRTKQNLTDLAWSAIAMGLFNGLLGAITIWFLAEKQWLGNLTQQIPAGMMEVIVVSLPFFVLDNMFTRALIGEQRYKFVNLSELATNVGFSLLMVLLVIVLDWGLLGANIAFFASRWGQFLANLVYIFVQYRPRLTLNWDVCRESYAYGLRIWLGGLTIFMNMYIDSLFVGWTMPAATMGNYSVAVTIARSLQMLPQAINVVLTNRLIGLPNQQAIQETALLHRVTLWLVAVVAVCIAVLGWLVLPWILPAFDQTPMVFLILLVGSVCSASFTILNSYFASQGMPGRSSLAQLVGFFIGGIATPFLVYRWSGIGGAIGSSLIYLVIAGLMWYFFWRRNSREAWGLFTWRPTDWQWFKTQLGMVTSRLRKRRSPT